MSDELDALRRLRPDRVLPDDPIDPEVLTRGKERLMAGIAAPTPEHRATPSIYPRLAYRDEAAALEFLVRAFAFSERREARMEHPDGTLAWLEVGDGVVMIGRSGAERHGLLSPIELGVHHRHGERLCAGHRRSLSACEGRGCRNRARPRRHVLGRPPLRGARSRRPPLALRRTTV